MIYHPLRTCAILIAFLVNNFPVKAQLSSNRFIYYMGAQLTDIHDSEQDYSAEVNFTMGVGYEIPVTSSISIRPELVYENLSTSQLLYDFDNLQTPMYAGDFLSKASYLSLPLTIRFYPEQLSFVYIEGAPQVSFRLSDGFDCTCPSLLDFNYFYDFTPVQLSLQAGIGGVLFTQKTHPLEINLRYEYGLTDLIREMRFGTVITQYGKGHNLKLHLGIFL